MDATSGYGEFHWSGDGIDIPGFHHQCSAQSIESSSQAEGGGARIEVNSAQDSFGRHQWQYLAHEGVQDADDIPLVLQSGERTVICLSLGPEPVQPTVSTRTNTAPTGSVSCTTGRVGEPFLSTLSVSDPDTPLIYQWSASGACSVLHATETQAWIQRRTSSGTCTVRVRVTDYYNASRTISSSCQVRSVSPATVEGVCSCSAGVCASGSAYDVTPPVPLGYDSRPPPLGSGPWNEEWWCDGAYGGSSDFCVEGSSCPSPVNGSCSGTINRCSSGNSGSLTTIREAHQTTHRWTCRGIAGGSNDSCEVINSHPPPCNPVTDRVNGACGATYLDCAAGDPERGGANSWLCKGRCGGTTATCNTTNPVDGACGNRTILNDCAAGNPQNVSGTTWNCLGINSGNNASCTLINPSVNGVCGQPNIGDCSVGVSSDPSGNTNPWDCAGSNGGTDATCYHGECGAANNTCVPGIGNPNNIIGSAEWLCEGNIAGNADDTRCVIAVCGDTQGTCDEGTRSANTNPWDCTGGAGSSALDDDLNCHVAVCGTADDASPGVGCVLGTWQHVDDTASAVLWKCEGSHSGSTADDKDCSDAIGTCDSTLGLRGKCNSGTSSDPPGLNDSWTCEGGDTNITTDDASCYIGVCDYDSKGDCADNKGDSSDPSGATNPWVCMGTAINSTTDDADCFIGVCGTADNAVQGCPVGTWAFASDLTSPTVIRWKCEGSDGGTDDDVMCEQEDGTCDTTPGDCDQGISSDPRGATNPWVCEGTGGGANETCVFSVCGTADNAAQGCLPNMPSTLPPPNASTYQDVTGHTWACQGNSRDINCHVGLCDYSGPGLCVYPSTPYDNGYEWTCEGANSSESADDVDCVIGQCKDVNDGGADNSLDGCITGEWDTNAPPGFWHCRGNHPNPNVTTDDDPNCEATGPVDGLCLYHTAGACANNGPSVGTDNAWTCEGRNGGVDAACEIGECGTADNISDGCIIGRWEDVTGDIWYCRGSDDTIETDDKLSCRGPVDPYGECGTADNQFEGCTFGIYDDITGPTWNCLGTDDTIDTDDDNCGPCDTGIPDIRTISGLSCTSNTLDYCFRQYGPEYSTCAVTAASHLELWGAWNDLDNIFWVIVGKGVNGGSLTLDCCAGPTPSVCPDGTTGTPPNCIPAQTPPPFSCHPFTGTSGHGVWTGWVDYGILGTIPPICSTLNACANALGDWIYGFLPNASDPDCTSNYVGGCDYCVMPIPVPQLWSDWYTPAMHGQSPP